MNKASYILWILLVFAGCGAAEVQSVPAQVIKPAQGPDPVEEKENKQEKARKQEEEKKRRELERIAQLIELLGHEKWRIREGAAGELFKEGKNALPLLLKAMENDDLEIKTRAGKLVKNIRKWLENSKPKFEQAIWRGDVPVVKYMMEQGIIDPVERCDNNSTYLHIAAMAGKCEIIELLIEKGIAAGSRDRNGITPLHVATTRESAELLISKGADVNVKDRYGCTPLHTTDYIEVANVLIEKGSDIEAKANSGYTPLLIAVIEKKADIVMMMISRGADVNSMNKKNEAALHIAAISNDETLCKLLVSKGARINAKDSYDKTPLDRARLCAHYGLVGVLRKLGGESGDDAVNLEYAAEAEDIELVKKLMKRGVDINSRISGGRTVLHWAAAAGKDEITRFLIENGADANSKDTMEQTPLHYAAGGGNNEVALLLLKAGASIGARDKCGRTPVHEAAMWEKKDMIKLLVEKGADINAKDERGETPLDEVDEEMEGFVRFVRSLGGVYGHDIDNLEYAVKSGDIGLLKKHFNCLEGIDSKISEERTLLHWAVLAGQKEVVEFLIEKGASIDVEDDMRQTPLHIAAGEGLVEIAGLLVKMGAGIDAKDKLRMTPLFEAVIWKKKEMIDFLLKKGAEINALDYAGYTPLDQVEDEETEFIRFLRQRGAKTSEELESGK